MAAKDKIGNIYDGRWKVVSCYSKQTKTHHDTIYKLKNIFNGKIIELDGQNIRRIEKGKTTVSQIYHIRLKRQHVGGYKF